MNASMFAAILADAIMREPSMGDEADVVSVTHDEGQLTVIIGGGERFDVTVTKLVHASDL